MVSSSTLRWRRWLDAFDQRSQRYSNSVGRGIGGWSGGLQIGFWGRRNYPHGACVLYITYTAIYLLLLCVCFCSFFISPEKSKWYTGLKVQLIRKMVDYHSYIYGCRKMVDYHSYVMGVSFLLCFIIVTVCFSRINLLIKNSWLLWVFPLYFVNQNGILR